MVEKKIDMNLVRLYLDNGVDVNCAQSDWSIEFDDIEDPHISSSSKNYKSLLHVAIQQENLELVKLLLEKGAHVNTNMIFTHGKIYSISCLQMAREQHSNDIVQVLLEHKATEAGEQDSKIDERNFNRAGSVISAADAPGQWAEKIAPPKKSYKFKGTKRRVKKKR